MSTEVLIVDDEEDIRILIADVLRDEGYEARVAGCSETAVEELKLRRPSLVLLDIWLEGSRQDGMELLETFKQEDQALPVVMISGHGNIEMAVAAIKKGAYDFIEKPFKTDRLLLVVERAIEAARLRQQVEELKVRAGVAPELIGQSGPISQVKQVIDKVAPTSSRVLITGQPGVGKEVVARMIHERSPRADGPFVVINCATMHPDRMEHELFGTEGGVDAGETSHVGKFELAHGGTLLLDEVADMPLETQGKIVRVLQDQRFERVGGSTGVEVDVRVMASTARDLNALMEKGDFREDLYYRLRVVPVDVPPLRLRRQDIAPLAEYLMGVAASRNGLAVRSFAADAIAALEAYHWPGNVRQLSNTIDWALIMAPAEDNREIRASMLPPEIIGAAAPVAHLERSTEIMALPLREARETFEREYLMAQVDRFGGNISRTAAFVGMERSALHRKLKTLGVTTGERNEAPTPKYDA